MIVPADAGVAVAADALRRGDVVALPTDTVYGVAVVPFVAGATDKLFAAKQRPRDVELPILVATPEDAAALVAAIPDTAARLIERFWPGPLTVVFDRAAGLGLDLGSSPDSIGIRCPDAELVRALARDVGPLATTSANLHGQPTPPTAAGVAEMLGDAVPVVVDGGRCQGSPSTVVSVRGGELRLLRQGRLPWEDVRTTARSDS